MDDQVSFVDITATAPREQKQWPTVLVRRPRIEAEIERLASIARPANGRRAVSVNHPMTTGPVPSSDEVLELLRAVIDPELGADIVTLGMVPGIETMSEGDLLQRFVRIELLLQALWHAPIATVALVHGAAPALKVAIARAG